MTHGAFTTARFADHPQNAIPFEGKLDPIQSADSSSGRTVVFIKIIYFKNGFVFRLAALRNGSSFLGQNFIRNIRGVGPVTGCKMARLPFYHAVLGLTGGVSLLAARDEGAAGFGGASAGD